MAVTTIVQAKKGVLRFFLVVMYLQMVSPLLAKWSSPVSVQYNNNTVSAGKEANEAVYPGISALEKQPAGQARAIPVLEKTPSAMRVQSPEQIATTGPTQPEMQSFQSVNGNNMVDLFTGDFSYNIPLLDVGGYPVNIHYSSGITMDQEASWVGLGWNINPGTITRNMRGLPDDFNGTDKVTKTLSIKDNKTTGVALGPGLEFLGFEKKPKESKKDSTSSLSLSASLGVFHNSYKGWGVETSINSGLNAALGSKSHLTSGLSLSNNSQSGFDVSPSIGYQYGDKESRTKGNITLSSNYNSRAGIHGLQMTGQMMQQVHQKKNTEEHNFSVGSGINSFISFSAPSFTPSITVPYTSYNWSIKFKVGGEIGGLFPNGFIRAYASSQKILDADKTQSKAAYGYLYYEQSNGNPDALLDFNREKETEYSKHTEQIAIPVYTYDTYSITGEGIGGMMRPYRNDMGMVYDHAMKSKSYSGSIGAELGLAAIKHLGVDLDVTVATTTVGEWAKENVLRKVAGFKRASGLYENVYFKNPGERTAVDQEYYNRIGGDQLMRVDFNSNKADRSPFVAASNRFSLYSNARKTGTVVFDQTTAKTQREKRTQLFSYLTAADAREFALDKTLKSYYINVFPTSRCEQKYQTIARVDPVRKAHHISEIKVLNADGRSYVYGIPVYNTYQQDASFAVTAKNSSGIQKNTALTGQTVYSGTENSVSNASGKDNYYSKEEIPAYTHSFLLSGILSPDYQDITGDGITEDDHGEAIKFNYSQVYNTDMGTSYRWRAPFDSAAFNEGLKTDNRDEKASYSYGQKEIWYLNSVESKNMIATFVLETDPAKMRQDSYGVNGIDGGLSNSQQLYTLKEINLYSKADFLKNGVTNAKPIKTVHFEYSYELCKKNPSSKAGNGKLTLKKIWFSYNGAKKGQRNPYVFSYHANNPDYLKGAVDRWGNYKDSRDNPGQLANADYPYSLQKGSPSGWDSTKAAYNVAAWTLTKIKLPSSGEIRVSYESDDYAYVQNKRAMQLFSIAGFASSATAAPTVNLYQPNKTDKDYEYVIVNISEPVSSKEEIRLKYLEGVEKLYFKLLVKMPSDRWGSGHEYIPFYAEIDGDNYGIRGVAGDKQIWIKLKKISKGAPAAVAALQFLRLNLPSKAYPFSEPGDQVNVKDFAKMLATRAPNIKQAVLGYDKDSRKKNLCNEIAPQKSFVRLCHPLLKKLGGGLRVKKVEIYDNFNKMSSKNGAQSGHQDAIYGQEYDYSTTVSTGTTTLRISSGVAAYEPSIGAEENPFSLPNEYKEPVSILAPVNFKYTTGPVGETFYPSPSVGYSKVSVRTIHYDKKSATGTDVTEFYTTRDFPTRSVFTPLDAESKRTYNPKILNFLKIAARHYLTLSQGFKVELNDMNGKVKSQASYAQNDFQNPLSYTYNYYRVANENSLYKQLDNTVMTADSAWGYINTGGMIGKEVELMIDSREQVSKTIAGSVGLNADITTGAFIPLVLTNVVPAGSSEINRFRSIAVTKVVNSYGILDSVIHIEKGSKVSTKNMVYDGETGEVVLSRTNNEYDDPVYNFSYPAHWAYSGMESAYKNLNATWTGVHFKEGKLYQNDGTAFEVSRYFESGDEIIVSSRDRASATSVDPYNNDYYIFDGKESRKKIWAIEAAKGIEQKNGLFFIDADGKPFSATGATIRILRSGKRNQAGVAVGSITSLASPVRIVNDTTRFVIDSTIGIINTAAAVFKDFWRVDSSLYRRDTTIIKAALAGKEAKQTFYPAALLTTQKESTGNDFAGKDKLNYFVSTSLNAFYSNYDNFSKRRWGANIKWQRLYSSWMKFDLTKATPNNSNKPIPKNAIITAAQLYLYNPQPVNNSFPAHQNYRDANSALLRRGKGMWVGDFIKANSGQLDPLLDSYYKNMLDNTTSVQLPATPFGVPSYRNDVAGITNMVQQMVDRDYETNGQVPPAINIMMQNQASSGVGVSSLNYNYQCAGAVAAPVANLSQLNNSGSLFELPSLSFYTPHLSSTCLPPSLVIDYCLPCRDGSKPVYSTSPIAGYYCYSSPVDTFVCKPNIVAAQTNPYRWGILGNWRMYRAYTYFDDRKNANPNTATNIRKDGELKNFTPYWQFNKGGRLLPNPDTIKWVWNSEMKQFNRKGYEIENRDPLNRYNGGQYGYNQTLPVAVAQNSRNRELMFDGLEDYGYQTDNCTSCATPRFIDLSAGGGTLVDSISHSGKYSIRLGGNQSSITTVQIVSAAADLEAAQLSIRDTTLVKYDTTVVGNGSGIAPYFMFIGGNPVQSTVPAAINHYWPDKTAPYSGVPVKNYRAIWQGKIQPKYTDDYIFSCWHDDNVTITINGVQVLKSGVANPTNKFDDSKSIRLIAGNLYTITVDLVQVNNRAGVQLKWRSATGRQVNEIVPASQLYAATVNDNTVIAATRTISTTTCTYWLPPQPKRITLDRFSPLQGQQMVIGAWVREEQLCIGANGYQNVQLQVQFNTGTPALVTLKPGGKVIEGWQRIEGVITIPVTATEMQLKLQSTNAGTTVFFDDLRMHPYNSNMKSFVYDPVNLRLMAELDENNYATYYEYDEEGTLVRLKKETERGIKTIKETRSALIKE